MSRFRLFQSALVSLLLTAPALGQGQPSTRADQSAQAGTAVPHLLRFSGVANEQTGAARRGTVGITFAIYAEREGGTPLWLETHNVTPDEQGRYSVLLGAASREGLPANLFRDGVARWLGAHVQLPGEREEERVLLASVPYAMKAADAETLGGRSATDYVLREQLTGWSGIGQAVHASQAPPGGVQAMVDGTGGPGFIPMFTAATTVANSVLFQNTNFIGLATQTPAAPLHVVRDADMLSDTGAGMIVGGATDQNQRLVLGYDPTANVGYIQSTQVGVNVRPLVFNPVGGAVGLGISAPVAIMHVAQDSAVTSDLSAGLVVGHRSTPAKRMMFGFDAGIDAAYVQATHAGVNVKPFLLNPFGGNVGIGTTTPLDALHVVGTVRTLGGIRFADGTLQTTAATGGGAGSVTSIATGTGLTGGPITSTGTIAIDTAVVPRLGVANTFTANQTINGNLTLTGTATVNAISGIFDGAAGGIFARDTTSASGVAVQGVVSGANAAAVFGSATANAAGAANVGVRGVAAGTNAAGVLAEATNTSGASAGIRAVSSSFTGTAARFDNNAGGNLIEGRWFDGGSGTYQLRFRVDSAANVYGVNFKDLTTGKNLQLSLFCIAGQIMKYDGTNWNCATDSVGTATGGATIVRTNTFLGTSAGNPSLTGNLNTAFGDNAMSGITSGNENTAFGAEALSPSSTLSRNSAFGRWALRGSSGADNTGIGNSALLNATGSRNTAVGFNALSGSNGSDNIGIGMSAGFAAGSDNSIWIGNQVSGGGSNTIRIGNTTTNPHIATYIAGIYGQPAAAAPVMVDANGKLGIVVSSQRFKEDITAIGDLSRKLMQLRPVQFFYKPQYDDGSRSLQFGLIAEEVHSVFPELVIYGKDGQPDTVRYHFLAPLLLSETQRLQAEVTQLREQLASHAAQIAEVKAALLSIQQHAKLPTPRGTPSRR